MSKFSEIKKERSAIEMIKAARRLIILKKSDPQWAGTYKVTIRRLDNLEKQLHIRKRRGQSQETMHSIAKELAQLIGTLCKSLICCTLPFHMKCDNYAFALGSLNRP